MRVVFVSNSLNHHQKPFSDELHQILGENYKFVETRDIPEFRKKLGYKSFETEYKISYKEYLNNPDYVRCIIDKADAVIFGSAPYELIENRVKTGKLVFRYSERPLKKGLEPLKYIPRLIKWHKQWGKSKNIYLLCASAYSSADYAKFGLFKNRAYKWGYFTEAKRYEDIDKLISEKETNSLLWVGRLIEFKHPDIAIQIAERLKKDGFKFKLDIIGTGELKEALEKTIKDKNLDDCVRMLGAMSPECVREYMEKSEIFLFTSDFNEGWGAVLNESMNSACAVVSSHAIGATHFLISDAENGLIYESENIPQLYEKAKHLLEDSKKRIEISKKAYETIVNEWSPNVSAERFINLSNAILSGDQHPNFYKSGICSVAKILSNKF